MHKTLVALAFSLVAGSALAQPAEPSRRRLDADGDGRFSLVEMTARALARFDRVDADRDGRLTPEERQAARERQAAERPERARPPVKTDVVLNRADVQARVERRFARLDADRDGFVTQEERRARHGRRPEPRTG